MKHPPQAVSYSVLLGLITEPDKEMTVETLLERLSTEEDTWAGARGGYESLFLFYV